MNDNTNDEEEDNNEDGNEDIKMEYIVNQNPIASSSSTLGVLTKSVDNDVEEDGGNLNNQQVIVEDNENDIENEIENQIKHNIEYEPKPKKMSDLFVHSGKPFGGLTNDLKKITHYYLSDYKDGLHLQCIASMIFVFLISVFPALIFGNLLTQNTNFQYGVTEVLLSNSVCGVLFALLGGQPLIIVSVTGPVSLFSITCYEIAQVGNIPFLPFMFWISFWAGIMHFIIGMAELCYWMRYVTRFSCELFGVLIGLIYLYDALELLVEPFLNTSSNNISSPLLAVLLAIGTLYFCITLHFATEWNLFSSGLRQFLTGYAVVLSVILFTGVSYLPRLVDVEIERLQVPSTFGTTSGRGWVVDVVSIQTWAIFTAIGPALLLTALFYFDHNVSSLMCQKPEYNLVKSATFNWDFMIIGLQLIICGILGLPFSNGLIPQAPLHTESLLYRKKVEINGEIVKVVRARENRITGFMQSALMGISLAALPLLKLVPTAVLGGVFLFMGFGSFFGNTFALRMLFLFYDSAKEPSRLIKQMLIHSKRNQMRNFTLTQMLLCAIIFAITQTPRVSLSFPLFILLLMPVRLFIFPKFFENKVLDALD